MKKAETLQKGPNKGTDQTKVVEIHLDKMDDESIECIWIFTYRNESEPYIVEIHNYNRMQAISVMDNEISIMGLKIKERTGKKLPVDYLEDKKSSLELQKSVPCFGVVMNLSLRVRLLKLI